MEKPDGWKDYDDFVEGIDTNRLPSSDALVGKQFAIALSSGTQLALDFKTKDTVAWSDDAVSDEDWYEAIIVAPNVYFVDITFSTRPRDSLSLIVNTQSLRVLYILSHVLEEKIEGEPQVTQEFQTGVLGGTSVTPKGPEPAATRDLIGLRAFYRYSPNHLYEHIYMSSDRYAWQCLVGEQRGHGDVDLATTYKFDEGQYIFTFREFIIPVASVFFYNWDDMRSTGKFLGITSDGMIENNPAGAFIQMASMTYYDKSWAPV